jgi:leucyl-tRNA synthetase
LTVPVGTDRSALHEIAMRDSRIRELTAEKEIVKVVAVPDKLVNVVVK